MTKYYGYAAEPAEEDAKFERLKKHFKRRSVADLLRFLVDSADEKILSESCVVTQDMPVVKKEEAAGAAK